MSDSRTIKFFFPQGIPWSWADKEEASKLLDRGSLFSSSLLLVSSGIRGSLFSTLDKIVYYSLEGKKISKKLKKKQ